MLFSIKLFQIGLSCKNIIPLGKESIRYHLLAEMFKEALSREEQKKLYPYQVEEGTIYDKARDFWFLSFLCNGMNIKGILLLRTVMLTMIILYL